ncbi:hypothetical protein ID866_3258 [Astraeus odoratus]|nr:hypothetical protein ID866_3258 [Astraeus odoratus]
MHGMEVDVRQYPEHKHVPNGSYPSSAKPQLPEYLCEGSISTITTSRTSASTESSGELFPLQRVTTRPKASYRLTDFIIHQTLGTGSFGRVHLVRSKHNLRFYAIKVLSKEKIVRTKQVEHTNNEKMLLEAVQHPFIVNLWGAFQDATNLYMVMDFVPGGELFTLLRRSGIVLQQRYTRSVDWYALGVLIFEMLTGFPPYYQPDRNTHTLYEHILRGPSFIRWPAFKPHATDIILKLMENDPVKRYGRLDYGRGDVFTHSWFGEVDWERLQNRKIAAPYLPKLRSDGDASAFERYPEDEAAAMYGKPGDDPYALEFPDFEYTSPTTYPSYHVSEGAYSVNREHPEVTLAFV